MQQLPFYSHSLNGPTRKLNISRNFLLDTSSIVKTLGLVFLFIFVAFAMQSATGFRLVIAFALFLPMAILMWKYPLIGAISIFTFLVLLGGIRRWLIPDFGWPTYDPLVIIGPLIPLLSFAPLAISRKIPSDTNLSRYVKYLIIIMVIQVVNPLQGSFLLGFGGILYYLAPLLWFYVGRVYGNGKILLFLLTFSTLAYTFSALYGLKQVIFGLAASEQAWIKLGGYEALNVSSDAIRVFSTFASQQEYAISLSCAISICAAFLIHRKILYFTPLLILGPALLLTAARGPIVQVLLAISIQWAVSSQRRSTMIPRLAFALLIGVVGITWSLSSIKTDNLSAGQGDLLRHQQEGLLNPADSTGPTHILMIGDGILRGIREPLGSGLGATTLAAQKLGGGVGGSETDFGNLFISLGIVGGVLYLTVIFFVFRQTSALWRESRNIIYLILIGILVVCFGQWLSGGLYSLCFLIWFSIGIMDKEFALKMAATSSPVSTRSKRGFLFNKRMSTRKSAARRAPLQPKSLL